eukprot:m.119172 g.119172  ORF g.119172 m.119172 type:complete len:209 (+) comp16146_c0_seq9:133-759(+)
MSCFCGGFMVQLVVVVCSIEKQNQFERAKLWVMRRAHTHPSTPITHHIAQHNIHSPTHLQQPHRTYTRSPLRALLCCQTAKALAVATQYAKSRVMPGATKSYAAAAAAAPATTTTTTTSKATATSTSSSSSGGKGGAAPAAASKAGASSSNSNSSSSKISTGTGSGASSGAGSGAAVAHSPMLSSVLQLVLINGAFIAHALLSRLPPH